MRSVNPRRAAAWGRLHCLVTTPSGLQVCCSSCMLTSTLGVSTVAEGFSQAPWPCQKETPGALGGGSGQEGSAGAFIVPSVDRGSRGHRVARSEVWGGKVAGVGHMAGEACSHPCLLQYRHTS